eukprot:6818122-Lingulodinium_polyedra.AAC.1
MAPACGQQFNLARLGSQEARRPSNPTRAQQGLFKPRRLVQTLCAHLAGLDRLRELGGGLE